jgi:hypothetical protein
MAYGVSPFSLGVAERLLRVRRGKRLGFLAVILSLTLIPSGGVVHTGVLEQEPIQAFLTPVSGKGNCHER